MSRLTEFTNLLRPFVASGRLSPYNTAVKLLFEWCSDSMLHTKLSGIRPDLVHQEWKGENFERVIVIGDVHGCREELEELLKVCNYNPVQDGIVFVGDLVNKGPDSVGVIRLARQLSAACCRGNHDEHALFSCLKRRCLQELLPTEETNNKPSDSTPDTFSPSTLLEDLQSYTWTDALTDDEIIWLSQLPYTLLLPPKFSRVVTIDGHEQTVPTLVVHAGLIPDVSLPEQDLTSMITMRDLVEKPEGQVAAIEESTENSKPWAPLWKGPWFVYFGHDAKRKLQQHPLAVGLDTGCCYGNCLTAAILPEHRLVSVPSVRMHVVPGTKPNAKTKAQSNEQ
eukprot:c2381_g1_i1.p1 GENE.c2381_g1_i1~~c2381_g1_i1.p1  ORF type:complete len:338 (-),score=51.79 c2381_g1_i1:62-1075(-)